MTKDKYFNRQSINLYIFRTTKENRAAVKPIYFQEIGPETGTTLEKPAAKPKPTFLSKMDLLSLEPLQSTCFKNLIGPWA